MLELKISLKGCDRFALGVSFRLVIGLEQKSGCGGPCDSKVVLRERATLLAGVAVLCVLHLLLK
jgi:hypothetical protein